MAIRIGKSVPEFTIEGIDSSGQHTTLCNARYANRWLIIVFYPRDFSFVCPTELTAFSARYELLDEHNCDVFAVSVDSLETHERWLSTPPNEAGLGPLRFPLASDPDGQMAQRFGVWDDTQNVSLRGLFIIDPHGILQYSVVHNLSVGRNVDEILRVLEALQSGGLCPASWSRADGTIDVEAALQPERVIGHYRIAQELGSGSFGSVYSARDLKLERMVALKVLKHARVDRDQELIGEARAAARLTHPNICLVYGIEEEDGLSLFVMEYLQGRPLDRVIAEGIDVARAFDMATQIADALHYAHSHCVIHGDLKPANVFLTESGTAKILDFGLANALSTPATPQTSESVQDNALQSTLLVATSEDSEHVIRGTPAYMSPEQTRGEPLSTASDVFSFGLLLCELFTGHGVTEGLTLVQTLDAICSSDFLNSACARLSNEIKPLVSRMLSLQPQDRPSMQSILQSLINLSRD